MTLPRFNPNPLPRGPHGFLVPSTEWPVCPCGVTGSLDGPSGLCRDCWRACVLAAAYARAQYTGPRLTYPGSDDISVARDTRDNGRPPSVTTTSSPEGVRADFDLGKGPRKP